NELDNAQKYPGSNLHSVAERGLEVVKKSARRGRDYRGGRVERDVDGRKRRLIFEEAATAFEPFDLGADFGELRLHFHRVRNFSRLLHDLQELRFERLLRADARFQVNVFLGYVLTRRLFVQDAPAHGANPINRRLEVLRGHADYDVDLCRGDILRRGL